MSYVTQVLADLRAAADQLQAEYPELAADERAYLDSLDGLTDGLDLAERLAEKVLHLDAMEAAAAERAKALQARAKRFAAEQERLRGLILLLLEAAGTTKLVRPCLTLSARTLAPKLACTDPDATPLQYTREVVSRVPDKDAIKEALALGAAIEGWHMTNGGKSLTLRTK